MRRFLHLSPALAALLAVASAAPVPWPDAGLADRTGAKAALIPYPRRIEWTSGEAKTVGWRPDPDGGVGRASAASGSPAKQGAAASQLPLALAVGAVEGAPAHNKEAYSLEITPTGARLTGASDAGLLWGLRTLAQIDPGPGKPWPTVRVTDWPAFPVRGFMHDTGRNFQEPATLDRFVSLLAAYKLNLFHWHLTDNPGYRIGSKKHPELLGERAWLPTRCPGKFYTFEQIRALTRRAWAQGVTILPEIDLPGHSAYFARVYGFDMQDPRGADICADLLEEFCVEVVEPLRQEGVALPWLHLGSDEVKVSNKEFLPRMAALARRHGLEAVVWRPGALPDGNCLTQLWAKGQPASGSRFLESRVNYVNHMDALDSVPHAFFHQPCATSAATDMALGAILCHWPDVNVGKEENIYKQSPVVPALLAASERFWRGLEKSHSDLWARLPAPDDPRLPAFAAFERDLVAHGARLAKDWPFPYAAQAAMPWLVLGPFDHGGDAAKSFPPESEDHLTESDTSKGKLAPIEVRGGTIHFRHFFDKGGVLPGNPKSGTAYAESWIWSPAPRRQAFWINFNTFSTSDRRGGPTPAKGQWSNVGAKVWLNGADVPGPQWTNAGYQPKANWSDETPFVDEGYCYREPAMLDLRSGWNRILIKAPMAPPAWKWMFTCLPVGDVSGLKFSARPEK